MYSDNKHQYFSDYDIFSNVKNLKHTAMGPDGLPQWFIHSSADLISRHLCNMFNDSIYLGCLPSCFKRACITPIPKTKNPKCYGDYRPISVISIFSCLLDKLVVKYLIYPTICDQSNLDLFQHQFGFCPTGSCENAIVALLDKITKYLMNNNYVNIVSTDISKAFDTVDHCSVLQALSKLKLDGAIYNWIVSYLSD